MTKLSDKYRMVCDKYYPRCMRCEIAKSCTVKINETTDEFNERVNQAVEKVEL